MEHLNLYKEAKNQRKPKNKTIVARCFMNCFFSHIDNC